jgi:hypothetical protein
VRWPAEQVCFAGVPARAEGGAGGAGLTRLASTDNNSAKDVGMTPPFLTTGRQQLVWNGGESVTRWQLGVGHGSGKECRGHL